MRHFRRAIVSALLILTLSSAFAAPKKICVLGDSLSREYQVEFPEFEDARNWVEILAENRPSELSFGEKNGDYYTFNNSVPTSTAEDYRERLTQLVWIGFQAIVESDLNDVDCVVIFLGGNDIDSVYGDIYNNTNPSASTTITNRIKSDLEEIIDYVRDEEPNVDMVLVNVPHVGATPEVKGDHPTDPVKTQRVTDTLLNLNAQLAALAQQKGIGYADVYTLTEDLLSDDDYFIGARPFINEGDDDGDPEYIWLGGDLSQNFHPNTQGQAVVANAIIEALVDDLGYNVTPLGNREIVEDIVGLDYDKIFNEWATGYSLTDDSLTGDDDKDGLINLLEFAFDLDPTNPDSSTVLTPSSDGAFFEFTYTPRSDMSGYADIRPQFSDDASDWQNIAEANITANPDGSLTARVPMTGPRVFGRVKVSVKE